MKLPQIITKLKRSGVYKRIAMPNGVIHPNDERALLEGCYFDIAAADRVAEFFTTLLRLPWPMGTQLNEWERYWIARCLPEFDVNTWQRLKPFVPLQWWQERVLSKLFGWKRPDGRRRFQKGFVTTAKKSGKSSTLSGLPIYMMTADGEMDAEAYASATTRDQASIIYKKVDDMLKRSPDLIDKLKRIASKKRVTHDASGSCFEAISSDADSAEGKNPHLLIADEVHVWKNRTYFESLMYGDIQRQQPLFLMITTAGADPESIGFEEYEFAKALLNPDDDFYSMDHFAYIAEAGRSLDTGEFEEREWDDPDGWIEANPSILEGVGSVEKLKSKCEEAKQSPRKKRAFIRYITNHWVLGVENAWLSVENWNKCRVEQLQDHSGDECWCGLDLSSVNDFTAFAIVWLCDDGIIDLKVILWLPSEKIKEKAERWRVPLQDWIDRGFIQTTPGPTVDYDWIRREISGYMGDEESPWEDSVAETYSIKAIAYDRWNSNKLIENELGKEDGMPIAEHGQGYQSMSAPAKELEERINSQRIRIEANPALDWMARNVVVDEDPAGNIKPNKKKSTQKIDGIAASIMAVGLTYHEQPAKSVYDDRGILLI